MKTVLVVALLTVVSFALASYNEQTCKTCNYACGNPRSLTCFERCAKYCYDSQSNPTIPKAFVIISDIKITEFIISTGSRDPIQKWIPYSKFDGKFHQFQGVLQASFSVPNCIVQDTIDTLISNGYKHEK
jgi:hypothetical protein